MGLTLPDLGPGQFEGKVLFVCRSFPSILVLPLFAPCLAGLAGQVGTGPDYLTGVSAVYQYLPDDAPVGLCSLLEELANPSQSLLLPVLLVHPFSHTFLTTPWPPTLFAPHPY